jgi:hypothetical protein
LRKAADELEAEQGSLFGRMAFEELVVSAQKLAKAMRLG